MKIAALDSAGDWTFGQGLGNYATGEPAIQENIKTKLMVFLGECFFALNDGIDWWNFIGGKNPAAQAGIILQSRQIIAKAYGVVRVKSVNAVLINRRLAVTYAITDIYSRVVTGAVPSPS